jgi:hypothetical protein
MKAHVRQEFLDSDLLDIVVVFLEKTSVGTDGVHTLSHF